jgi:ion channel
MVIAVFSGVAMIFLTVGIHFIALRTISTLHTRWHIPKDAMVVLSVCGVFLAHTIEISCYAATYYWLVNVMGIGSLVGPISNSFMDYFYYSTVMYTSLGIGDLSPSEHLRIISGLEVLNGLVLIGWSTSFTFLTMRRFWTEV